MPSTCSPISLVPSTGQAPQACGPGLGTRSNLQQRRFKTLSAVTRDYISTVENAEGSHLGPIQALAASQVQGLTPGP